MGNLSTPKSVQKLQMVLHAKAKAEAGYRFYALYDKISRADILAHAYAQCRSNKGAPGVDGQNFTDIAAYGVQRRVQRGWGPVLDLFRQYRLLLLATSRHPGAYARESALPPTSDIQMPMSAFGLITSGLPPEADVPVPRLDFRL